MIHRTKKMRGFTLIELMLAMAFVSMLLLAIAMTVIQAGGIYSKGMALKDINQSGRVISDDIRRTVAASGVVQLDDTSYVSGPTSGRLCLGNYSYLWNTVDAVTGSNDTIHRDATYKEPISLVKVPDTGRAYCARDASGKLLASKAILPADAGKITDLLVEGDHSLSITAFSADPYRTVTDALTGQRLMAMQVGIGTGQASSMNADRTGCLVPGDDNADPIYCNVQIFDFVVRAGGGGV